MPTFILSLACVLLTSVFFYLRGYRGRRLPPGPSGLPLIGNILNAPSDFAWKTYAEWSKKYASNIKIFGTHIIIVNSREVASDLLEKRSRLYSGRPSSYMASHLVGCDWMLACLPYSDVWRMSRRLLAQYFSRQTTGSRTTVPGFIDFEWQRPHVLKYTHNLLKDLYQQPDLFMDHNFQLAASVSISSTYGLDVTREGDEHIALAQKAGNAIKLALTPGRFLVDTFPILKFAPEWVSFKQLARSWREDVKRFLVVPFVHGRENLKRLNFDVEIPSLLSQELSRPDGVDQLILQESSATVFIGATASTSAALNTFILAMTCYPEAQKLAQTEIDTLMSKKEQKLPVHADLEHLPFCMALVYEVLRWHVIGPIAMPHLCTEDDVYNDYRIPKGSIIIPNVWAMMRDPKLFHDPLEFRPQRFLNADGSLSDSAVKTIDPVFGFGRSGLGRVCIGRSMGMSILAYAACCVLAVFDIKKKLDEKGEIIEPRVEFDSSVTSSPLSFICSITPRSAETAKVIQELDGLHNRSTTMPHCDSSAPSVMKAMK